MAPIHDTDLAEERWSKAEWERFELWEKIEHRLRRRRFKINVAVGVLFLVIVAIPPAIDRWPKWEALWLNGRLAKAVGDLKRMAATEHQAFRIRFDPEGKLSYVIERAPTCSESGVVVRQGSLATRGDGRHRLIPPEVGARQGIPGLVSVLCYDPARGMMAPGGGVGELMGVVVAPVNDLASGRKDRMSVLLVSGPFGELSLE